jgi:hypothetical protein
MQQADAPAVRKGEGMTTTMTYTTEKLLRAMAQHALAEHDQAEKPARSITISARQTPTSMDDESIFHPALKKSVVVPNGVTSPDDPRFEEWVQAQVEKARKSQRLVTEQQLVDLRRKRLLQQGDRARYVGMRRLEPASSGRSIIREPGQTGYITAAARGDDGRWTVTFRPDAPKGGEEVGIEIVELTVAEGAGILDLERIP